MIKRDHYYIKNNEIVLRTWENGINSDKYWLYFGITYDRAETCHKFTKITNAINFVLKHIKNNKWNVSFETVLQLTKLQHEVRKNEDSYIILSKQSKSRKQKVKSL